MSENRTRIDQFQLRLPPGLRDELKLAAARHERSVNSEIVARLQVHGGQEHQALRAHYAGLAMQGLLAGDPDLRYGLAAQQAVAHADALVAELSKGNAG